MANRNPTAPKLSGNLVLAGGGQYLVGEINARDPDGGPVILSTTTAGFTVVGNQLFTSSALSAAAPTVRVRLVATDAEGAATARTVALTVAPVPPATLAVDSVVAETPGPAAAGAEGDAGTSPGANGAVGGAGDAGAAAVTLAGAALWVGGQAADTVSLSRQSTGGYGGLGGAGGQGADGQQVVTRDEHVETSHPWTLDIFRGFFTDAGNGGAGGTGGAGGDAVAVVLSQSFALGAGPGFGQDSVTLAATAEGGIAGAGGDGASGGYAGADITGLTYLHDTAPAGYGMRFDYGLDGGAGGDSGAGGAGGAGGSAAARIAGTAITTVTAQVTLTADALGGRGGEGGLGGALLGHGGEGGTPGSLGAGGAGGAGGDAVAEVTGVSLIAPALALAATRIDLVIAATAVGGQGGVGGDAREATLGFGIVEDSTQYIGGPTPGFDGTRVKTPGAAGEGGAGGAGGDATARIADLALRTGGAQDAVALSLAASAGFGGQGGAGSMALPATSDTTQENGHSFTVSTLGRTAGADGLDGAGGKVVLALTGTAIDLGAGDDVLSLSLLDSVPDLPVLLRGGSLLARAGDAQLVFSGNAWQGGEGQDTLDLSNVQGARAVVDVGAGTLSLAGSRANTIGGFETFFGGMMGDLFRDGAGDQTYRPGFADRGANQVIFAPGHGHDRLELDAEFGPNTWARTNKIAFTGFGPGFDSIAEVRAAATVQSGGTLIATPDGGDVFLVGIPKEALTAGLFLFG